MTRQELLQTSKPILFNTEMVRAILDGRKSATRRAVKFPSVKFFDVQPPDNLFEYQMQSLKSPYQEGDILYVRETWSRVGTYVDEIHFDHSEYMYDGMYLYKADGHDLTDIGKWRPSIHMPKEAARIFLRVTDVGVERLQDITLDQLEKEGLNSCYTHRKSTLPSLNRIMSQSERFMNLWNSTVKEKDKGLYGWEANPYVWVYEFERMAVE